MLLRRSRLARLMGLQIEAKEVEQTLNSLQFRVLSSTAEGWTVALPTARMDVEREIDLIEEIARHHGYGNLPSTLPAWQGSPRRRKEYQVEKIVTERLLHLGYSQTLTYPLVDMREDRKFSATHQISLLNPLSSETGVMRTSLLPGLLASLSWNYNRGLRSLKVFEIGKVYGWVQPQQSREESRVGLLVTGNREEKTVHGAAKGYSLFDLKGISRLCWSRRLLTARVSGLKPVRGWVPTGARLRPGRSGSRIQSWVVSVNCIPPFVRNIKSVSRCSRPKSS